MSTGADGQAYGGEGFSGLFSLVGDYSRGALDRQRLALKLIAGAYVRTCEEEPLPDAKHLVDHILERNGYFVPYEGPGSVYPQSIYAVLNVAAYSGGEEDRRWGASRLCRIMEAASRHSSSGKEYGNYAVDVSIVSSCLTQLVKSAQVSRNQLGFLN